MTSSIETTSTTTTLKNNGNTYLSVDTNDDVTVTNDLAVSGSFAVASLNGGQLGGRRNIVYNGEMKVAQRSTSETGLGAATGYFTLDRWRAIVGSTAGRFTMAQIADGPAGFANCLKLTTTTADTSIAAGEIFVLSQHFEGQDLQQLQKGTATAKQVTVSFYVKGNASATYVCELNDGDNTRINTQSFAVTTSWNRIELTFAADTTGALDDDNGESLSIIIWLHAGSTYSGGTFASNTWAAKTDANRAAVGGFTSIFDSTSRTFFITGVQMELGDTATAFEHRSYGEELALCQRYYEQSPNLSTYTNTRSVIAARTNLASGLQWIVPKRAAPAVVIYSRAGTANKMSKMNDGGDIGTVSAGSPTTVGLHQINDSAAQLVISLVYEANYTADAEL